MIPPLCRPGFKVCSNCDIEKDIDEFYCVKKTMKTSYLGKRCKKCWNVKRKPAGNIRLTKSSLSDGTLEPTEIKKAFDYVSAIRRRKYAINEIDFWLIIHHYEYLWPGEKANYGEKMNIQIIRKWSLLESWYIENKNEYANCRD